MKGIKCYHCGELIETDNQLVEKKIPMATKAGVKNYRRKFHIGCLPEYVSKREDKSLLTEENNEWDKVYRYFRKEILNLNESTKLDEHAVKRLLGLRVGMYFPQGNNTRILKRGYDFGTILITMKVVKPKVKSYISRTQFKDNKHKIDTIMKFIVGEINDVAKRIESNKKAEKKVETIEVNKVDYKETYKKKGKADKNENINKLFGGLL